MNILKNLSFTCAALRWGKALPACAGLALSLAVHAAAVPANWWVDVANDRAGDIKAMLAQGADPNAVTAKGQPAIMQAVRDGAWHVYDVLAADSRTKVEVTNINHETPLMYLSVVGQTRRAEALIARGAQVNRLGWTPLQYAASKGHLDTVQMLVAHHAIIDAPSPDGTTALMMAAFSGSQPVVQYLLDHGAVPIVQNMGGHDAADWARLGKHDELADKLHALIQKTLAERAAQRARDEAGQAGATAGAQAGEPGGAPAAPGEAPAPKQAQPAPEGSDSGNSTSKYFNPEDNASRPAPH
jgi:ankyrin repeat protein